MDTSYAFASEPAAVRTTASRQKYRDPTAPAEKSNIMHDRRVVRGNTYSAVVPTIAQQKAIEQSMQNAERVRKARIAAQNAAIAQQRALDAKRAASPEPLPGRSHMGAQTDNVLEELVDKVFEAEKTTQTDAVDDRPDPPKFKTKDPGVEAETQIYAGDLFDFDLGVQPILEVLVGKALDQGLMEVLEEEEIKRLEATKRAFEQKRDALIADAQRLEEATERRYAEKERRLKQERERVKQEQDVARKLAAQVTAKQYLASLQNEAVAKLEAEGHFYDPVVRQVQHEFMPWLLQRVASNLHNVEVARQEVDALVDAAVRKLIKQRDDKIRADREAAEARERKRLADEAEAKRLAEEKAAKLAAEKAQREREEEERRKKEEADELERERREAEGDEGDDRDDRRADDDDDGGDGDGDDA